MYDAPAVQGTYYRHRKSMGIETNEERKEKK